MSKYYFIVSRITKVGKVEQKKVEMSNTPNKFSALNVLREIYPDQDYSINFIDNQQCSL